MKKLLIYIDTSVIGGYFDDEFNVDTRLLLTRFYMEGGVLWKPRKKFDSVKMMRDIRDKVNADIKNMSSEQILDYIKKGRTRYEKLIANK